jgi:hypothetical protein
MNPKCIMEKNGFQFFNNDLNHYSTNFEIKSTKLDLTEILNFDLMKLVYDLNPEIFEDCKIEKISETKAKFIILFKPFFKDIGLPQRFAYVEINREVIDDKIIFTGKSLSETPSIFIPDGCLQLPTKKMRYECVMVNKNHTKITQNIYLETSFKIQPFIEKFIGNILIKIFLRVKQFIENYS